MRIEKTRLRVERVRTVQGATFQGEQGISHIFYFSLLTKHPWEEEEEEEEEEPLHFSRGSPRAPDERKRHRARGKRGGRQVFE